MKRYRTGDTAGVGLNLETGEGFVTLNGRLLETSKSQFAGTASIYSPGTEEGFAHSGNKFNNKKMYPCVGYDNPEPGEGLKFEWNLGGSLDAHPFLFKDLNK